MKNLIPSSIVATLTGALGDHFYTFTQSKTRLITIHKEPQKTVDSTLPADSPVYGYSEPSNIINYTYTTVTGIYPAMILYDKEQKESELEDVKSSISKGQVRIKVETDARNFIEDGRKNEKIEFDNIAFNIITTEGVQNFLGLKYYIYKLEQTT